MHKYCIYSSHLQMSPSLPKMTPVLFLLQLLLLLFVSFSQPGIMILLSSLATLSEGGFLPANVLRAPDTGADASRGQYSQAVHCRSAVCSPVVTANVSLWWQLVAVREHRWALKAHERKRGKENDWGGGRGMWCKSRTQLTNMGEYLLMRTGKAQGTWKDGEVREGGGIMTLTLHYGCRAVVTLWQYSCETERCFFSWALTSRLTPTWWPDPETG